MRGQQQRVGGHITHHHHQNTSDTPTTTTHSDLPDAEIKPPENVLFVCKLNAITTDEDLEIIFSRFGDAKADIVRDPLTGDSLNYAFVEFDNVSGGLWVGGWVGLVDLIRGGAVR